jgi:hypothetical protein
LGAHSLVGSYTVYPFLFCNILTPQWSLIILYSTSRDFERHVIFLISFFFSKISACIFHQTEPYRIVSHASVLAAGLSKPVTGLPCSLPLQNIERHVTEPSRQGAVGMGSK